MLESRSNRRAGLPGRMSFWNGTPQILSLWTGGSPLSRLLLGLEGIVIMAAALGPLLIAHGWKEEPGALSLQVTRGTYEFLVLALLVLFWCGWCEGGYRLGQQLGSFATVPWPRRLTLELWTGVLSSLLLSVLTSLNPLLPLVAVFLLFGGIEALKGSGLGLPLWASLRRGFRESFHTVSLAPLRLLRLMVVPGLLLYMNNLLLRILQIRYRDLLLQRPLPGPISSRVDGAMVVLAILIVVLALLGIGLFFNARADLALHYLQIQHIQALDPLMPLDKVLTSERRSGRRVAAFMLFSTLLFGLYLLVNSELFSRSFFYMTLEASVGIVNSFVQSLIDLLAKFSFIIVVLALIIGLCVILVSLAKGNGGDLLNRSLSSLGRSIQSFSAFISQQINLPGQAIQITTLLSAVGLIATQTYSKIVETQSNRLEQQRREELQVKLLQQRTQSYGDRAENQILRFQQNLESLASKDQNGSGWLDLERRSQVASLTQDLMRQLKDLDGNPDRSRRARVLKYLYDSRFLIENEAVVAGEKTTCKDALSQVIEQGKTPRTLRTLPQFVLDRKLIDQNPGKTTCNLARLVPLNMDFSHASLRGAILNNAALPFINLSHADLQGAQLQEADLRFANLSNANLRGVDLTNAKLDYADLANAELRTARLKKASFKGAILFYATTSESEKLPEGSLSWDLTRQESDRSTPVWCPLDPRMNPENLNPGAVDLEAATSPSEFIAQAGAKCSNRSYSGFRRQRDRIQNRNWASGDFSGTTIENFRLHGIDFTNANLQGAVFRYVRLNDVVFTGANLKGARFEHSVLNNVDFTGANIRRMVFVGSSAERLTFRGSQYVLPIELGDYAKDLLLLTGRNMDLSTADNQSPPARLAQKLLLPILLAPFPLRPSRVLIWLVPYSPELVFASEDRQSIP